MTKQNLVEIRLNLTMAYQVPADLAAVIMENDVRFFNQLKQDFNNWGNNPEEPRDPVEFNFSHLGGPVVSDEEE